MPDSAAILICTRNRHRALARTLESLASLRLPEGTSCRVRIVDNGSTPPVRGCIAWSRNDLPLEILEQPRPGKSAALNLGLRDLPAQVVAFTDDDMEFDPDWLKAAVERFRSSDAVGLLGRTAVQGEESLPTWFTAKCALMYGATPPMDDGAPAPGLPGLNSFARRQAIDLAGPFREDLGPAGDRLGYSEDIEWSHRLAAFGRLEYCHGARAWHVIPPARLDRWLLFRRQVDFVRTEVLLDGGLPAGDRRWAPALLPGELKGLAGALARRRRAFQGFDYWLEIAGRLGRIWGLLQRLGASSRTARLEIP